MPPGAEEDEDNVTGLFKVITTLRRFFATYGYARFPVEAGFSCVTVRAAVGIMVPFCEGLKGRRVPPWCPLLLLFFAAFLNERVCFSGGVGVLGASGA